MVKHVNKTGNDRPRPIVVRFSDKDKEKRHQLLIKSGKTFRSHSDTDPLSKCFVKADPTPTQQQEQSRMVEEMRTRKGAGENVTIYRSKMVPARIHFAGNDRFGKEVRVPPTVLLANYRSVVNKFDDLCATIRGLSMNIACVNDGMPLYNGIPSSLFNIPGFSLLRCDRSDRHGGGVCM